jgi:methylenetetrahydrofolate reductase (NADPH)
MANGPCAGVTPAGDCEVPDIGRCAFVDLPPALWPYDTTTVTAAPPAARPLVIADFPAAPLSSPSLRDVAAALTGAVDAVLTGDHGGARVQFPPSYRARLLADAGVPAWVGLNCRDRNRVALEGEIAACVDAGAAGLHCVTGDHPALGLRPDAAPVFDLDSVELLALATGRGLPCSVAHAPDVAPAAIRLPRLLAKLAAGADTVFVDHCGGPAQVAAATSELRATGFTGTVLACVPVVLNEASALVLLSFAAGRVPGGYVEGIVGAADPWTAGIAAAVQLSLAMLAAPGVDGVNLSGGTRPGDEVATAAALAETALSVRAQRPQPVPA